MASLDSLKIRQTKRKGLAVRSSDAAAVMIRLTYIGDGTVTSVTVTTATDVTLVTVSAAAVTNTDAIDWVTYGTVGAVVDAINATGRWEARVLDALRADTVVNGSIVTGIKTASALGYYDLLADNTVDFWMTARLTYSRNMGLNPKLLKGHRVLLDYVNYLLDVTTGATSTSIKIYQYNPVGQTEDLVWTGLNVDSSVTTLSWAGGKGYLTAPEGCDIIVRIVDASGITGQLTAIGWAE